MSSKFLVSYCTTTMDRLHHVGPTLLHNLYVCRNLPVELVVLDYGSTDGFVDWMASKRAEWNKGPHAPNGRCLLNVYRFDGPKVFHSSHAKNMVHRLAQGEIVCNIDADTYISEGLTEMLVRELSDGRKFLGPANYAFYGTLGFVRSDFDELGGYDEDMVGYSYEDTDLALRAERFGLTRFILPAGYNVRITHDDHERMKNFVLKDPIADGIRNQGIAASRTHWKANTSKRIIGEGEVRMLT
jgi:hypothetical protein